MYTEYNYKYMSTIEIFVIESYSYTSMYTKYNYIYKSAIKILKTISIIEIKLYLINETISI